LRKISSNAGAHGEGIAPEQFENAENVINDEAIELASRGVQEVERDRVRSVFRIEVDNIIRS